MQIDSTHYVAPIFLNNNVKITSINKFYCGGPVFIMYFCIIRKEKKLLCLNSIVHVFLSWIVI